MAGYRLLVSPSPGQLTDDREVRIPDRFPGGSRARCEFHAARGRALEAQEIGQTFARPESTDSSGAPGWIRCVRLSAHHAFFAGHARSAPALGAHGHRGI